MSFSVLFFFLVLVSQTSDSTLSSALCVTMTLLLGLSSTASRELQALLLSKVSDLNPSKVRTQSYFYQKDIHWSHFLNVSLAQH